MIPESIFTILISLNTISNTRIHTSYLYGNCVKYVICGDIYLVCRYAYPIELTDYTPQVTPLYGDFKNCV